jgi:alkylated DNA repair dioxygenase AlkB
MKLPLNCTTHYYDDFLSPSEADELYQLLLDEYKLDKARIIIEVGGKIMETDSFKILFATDRLIESNSHPEHIHGKVHPWKGPMAKLREKVEAFTNHEFELAMCLYYPDGNFFTPYHSDQQTSGQKTLLPSLSLGEERDFTFREVESENEAYRLNLKNGSMLLMGEHCQFRYQHSLPKEPEYKNGRINITFREPSFK